MPFVALLAVTFVLVVDQIDGGVAAVEVDGEEVAHVPVSLLPADVSEGDRLVVRVRSRLTRALHARQARRVRRLGETPEHRPPPEESRT